MITIIDIVDNLDLFDYDGDEISSLMQYFSYYKKDTDIGTIINENKKDKSLIILMGDLLLQYVKKINIKTKEYAKEYIKLISLSFSRFVIDWIEIFPEDRIEMKPLVNNFVIAYLWAIIFPQDRNEMAKIVMSGNDALTALMWATSFHTYLKEMKEVVIRAKNGMIAVDWAKKFPDDKEEMYEVVLQSKDPQAALGWVMEINDYKPIKELDGIIRSSKDKAILSDYNWVLTR